MSEKKTDTAPAPDEVRARFRLPALFSKSTPARVGPRDVETVSDGAASPRVAVPVRAPRTRPSFYLLSLIGLVVIPAFFTTFYLVYLASDQFIAEARFAVRKAQIAQGSEEKPSGILGSVGLGSAGSGIANQEAHIVANYLRSRAAIEDIQKDLNVIEIFQRPEADFFARLKKKPSMEDLVDYWNTRVAAYVDGPSGVVTVSARAFRPDDAKRLVDAFLVTSERLTNHLSERARRDAMVKSEAEVHRTEAMVRGSLAELRQYRDQQGLITPLMEATSTSKLLSETLADRIKLQNDYFVAARALSANAPSVQGLKSRLEGLDIEIEKLKNQLTNNAGEARTVSAAIVRFEELEIKRVFSEKMYSLAQDALERARLRAEQQAIYFSVFVPAHLPEEARYPERYSLSLILSIGFLLLWGVGALTVAAVEDHKL